jgi:hypothetical protein
MDEPVTPTEPEPQLEPLTLIQLQALVMAVIAFQPEAVKLAIAEVATEVAEALEQAGNDDPF